MKLKVEKMVCCTDSYALCYDYIYSSKHIFGLFITVFCHAFQEKVFKFILTHTFLALVTVGLGHGVYRKLCSLIGGQRVERFENHWFTLINHCVIAFLFALMFTIVVGLLSAMASCSAPVCCLSHMKQ